jgi:hypothetical protein
VLRTPRLHGERITVVASRGPDWGSLRLILDAARADQRVIVRLAAETGEPCPFWGPDEREFSDEPFCRPPREMWPPEPGTWARTESTSGTSAHWTAHVTVVDENGRPVPFAALDVGVEGAAYAPMDSGVQDLVAWTDPSGQATLPQLRGAVFVQASYGSRSATATLDASDPVVRLQLE